MNATDRLSLALITDVFPGAEGPRCLEQRLREARARGATLAVLPELPLDPWVAATQVPRDEDAEPPGGRRHAALAAAARTAGIAVVGGAIVRDPVSGARHNTALVFDASGTLVGSYRKLHLPDEEGYWEAHHYEAGDEPPHVIDALDWPLGLQICSDVNRPELVHALAALGAELVVAPRCTPQETYPRWKLVLRADAVTAAAYVVSTNRPRPEQGVDIGGPSIVVAPDGEVVSESEEPLRCVTLERDAVLRARRDYPGYLDVRSEIYARAWERVARLRGKPQPR